MQKENHITILEYFLISCRPIPSIFDNHFSSNRCLWVWYPLSGNVGQRDTLHGSYGFGLWEKTWVRGGNLHIGLGAGTESPIVTLLNMLIKILILKIMEETGLTFTRTLITPSKGKDNVITCKGKKTLSRWRELSVTHRQSLLWI